MNQYQGKCRCGAVSWQIELPCQLATYTVRKCDCDFCLRNNIRFLSDANGALHLFNMNNVIRKKQGSNQSEFLSCKTCESIVGVIYETKKRWIGAVNSECLSEHSLSKHSQSEKKSNLKSMDVSPKALAVAEKVERWQALWFPATLHQGVAVIEKK